MKTRSDHWRYLPYRDRQLGFIRRRKVKPLKGRAKIDAATLYSQQDPQGTYKGCWAGNWCKNEVPSDGGIACYDHWFKLPRKLRSQVMAVLKNKTVSDKVRKQVISEVKTRLQSIAAWDMKRRHNVQRYTVVSG